MNETTLPPSPNWYLSNILSCADDGTIAWGARNVVVINKHDNNKGIGKYSIIKNAHKDRVTSVSFDPNYTTTTSNLLASTGEDSVKIWNTDTLATMYSYVPPNDKHIVGVDWCPFVPLMMYCLTTDGSLFLWNLRFSDTVSVFTLKKVSPSCLSCCPHLKNIVAIGCKTGLVYIINFGSKSLLYKLRGHDAEVLSLSWCPSDKNIISKTDQIDVLLASAGRDKYIFIWRAGGDGRYETQIPVPTAPLDSSQHRSKLNSSTGNWIVLNWIESNLLLASSAWGELISWDLSNEIEKKSCKLVHSYHLRGLFCIGKVPLNIQDEKSTNSHTIWTVAQDRQIICCSVTENCVTLKHKLHTQGGYVYCIDACPLDTSRIAFGVGDAMLRLWNLSEAHSTSSNIIALWQKIKGKIHAISWHPEKENWLAYATDEGRVGVFDVNSNKPPVVYRQYHRDKVYTISWGPIASRIKFVLYSCAEGELVYYDPAQPDQAPKSVLKKECAEFAWKPDFSCLAAGLEDGSIILLDQNFTTRGTIKQHKTMKKRVYCIAWHPESTAADLQFSPLRNCLAVAYDSCTITIFDVTNCMSHIKQMDATKDETADSKPDLYNVHEVVATLYGHTDKVVCLAWSPHFSGYLISGSYDNTAQVWNVETQELMATYTGHSGPVLCAMWSPLHSDFIITGSADFTVRIWCVAEQTPQRPTETFKKLQNKKNKKKAAEQAQLKKSDNSTVENTKQNGAVDVGISFPSNSTTQTVGSGVKKETKKKKVEQFSHFPKLTKLMNDKKIVLNSLEQFIDESLPNSVVKCKIDDEKNDKTAILPIFAGKDSFLSFISEQEMESVAERKQSVATEINIWSNQLKNELEEAARDKRLNDFLVSLAPNLSAKVWKEMCEAYANQLLSEGNPQKAVSYLLCIHKTYEAINILENAHLYKEAYCIAQCRLDPDDSAIISILEKWAEYTAGTGRFEEAAHIYAKLKDFQKTVKFLARRRDANTLSVAANISMAIGDNETSLSLADEAINTALAHSEFDFARSVIAKFPQLKYREIHVQSLEELREIRGKEIGLKSIVNWIEGNPDYGLLCALKSKVKNINSDCYSELQRNIVSPNLENEDMLWVAISHEIAMAILCVEKQRELRHIINALSMISQYEVLHRQEFENRHSLLLTFAIHLDNKSPTSTESIYTNTDCPATYSLRAYLCFALMDWLVKLKYESIEETKVTESENIIVNLIINLNILDDILNPRAIKHWSIQSEISKLENQLATALSQKDEEQQQDIIPLKEQLNKLKEDKKEFINERVSVPNPIMAYSKANELISKIINEELKKNFSTKVTEVWGNAISNTVS